MSSHADDENGNDCSPVTDAGSTRSAVSQEIERLRKAVIEASSSRERLPQPLFWSLFHTQLDTVRKAKKLRRDLKDILES